MFTFVQCCFVLFFDSKIAVESRNGLGFYLFIRTPLQNIQKTEVGFKGKWFKKLTGSKGVFEFRESDHQFWYRILSFWDKTEKDETLILCTHGFNKKSAKTPPKEIKRAEAIKNQYFKNKKNRK